MSKRAREIERERGGEKREGGGEGGRKGMTETYALVPKGITETYALV